ncbi:alpha/beta fold hydrolase [Kribbella sp. NPDC056861]|uniref:alpha/beta fold hydrolase n=1 Tax=Kribbella sp. NPDC056861 TaxID=3154857 RepID=UPI00341F9B79
MTAEFFAAYDSLLARWGVPTESIEVEGEFGVTRVNACGAVDAPPLVLLAGYGAGGSPAWFGVAPQLAQYRRVFAVDLVGDAGRSAGRVGSQAELHRWLGGVLDGLGVERADFCGHSYGAWVSLSYALQSPGRVGKLALLDPTDCFTGLSPSYIARALPMLLRPTPERVRSFLRWETRGIYVDPDWLDLAALAAEFPAAGPVRPRRPDLKSQDLEAELLVVVAGRSRTHDPERLIRRMGASAPQARVVRLPAASHHSIPAGHAEELAGTLEKFLR